MGRLSGKIALVTGTAGGIGRASALTLAREGARVVGCDLQPAGSAETVRLAREAGGEMTAMAPVDLSSEAGANGWAADAVAIYGGVDILVNNASAIRFGPISSLSVEDWSFTIRNELDIVFLVTRAVWPHLVNNASAIRFGPISSLSVEDWSFTIHNELDIVFLVTRAVWPHLVARGGGSIVNIASISATRGAFFMPQNAHGAAKGGVLSLTYQLVTEGGPYGIRVNAVSPAMTATPQTAPLLAAPDSPFAAELARIPLGRVGQPEDVANAVLFLASDESAHVSGANIPVDGGAAAIG